MQSLCSYENYITLAMPMMHSLAAASRPRLSEMEPNWSMFETSCYAFGGRIRRFAKVNATKVTFFTVSYTGCKLFLSMYTLIILVNTTVERNTPAHHSIEL